PRRGPRPHPPTLPAGPVANLYVQARPLPQGNLRPTAESPTRSKPDPCRPLQTASIGKSGSPQFPTALPLAHRPLVPATPLAPPSTTPPRAGSPTPSAIQSLWFAWPHCKPCFHTIRCTPAAAPARQTARTAARPFRARPASPPPNRLLFPDRSSSSLHASSVPPSVLYPPTLPDFPCGSQN